MSMFYLIGRVLGKLRFILDEMCRLYRKFASYLRRVLCKTRLIFPRINGPNIFVFVACNEGTPLLRGKGHFSRPRAPGLTSIQGTP